VVAKDDARGSTRDADGSDCDVESEWSSRKRRSGVAIVVNSGEHSPKAICEVVDGDKGKRRMVL
jgi:hypothetical protein